MKAAKDYIVFPLDVPDPETARTLVSLLANEVGMFKVGLELFIRSGPELVRWIMEAGSAKVFLDLKLHDIPVTVNRAMSRVADLGVFFATVHCGDSRAMLEAAVEGRRFQTLQSVHVQGVVDARGEQRPDAGHALEERLGLCGPPQTFEQGPPAVGEQLPDRPRNPPAHSGQLREAGHAMGRKELVECPPFAGDGVRGTPVGADAKGVGTLLG